MGKEKRGPLLDLERSRISRAFSLDESLWKAELLRLFRLLKLHVYSLRSQTGKEVKELPTLAIAIFGTYGSGKSSLLKTFRRCVNQGFDHRGEDGKSYRKLKKRVRALPVIDLGLFSENGHFLYAFLATALEEALEQEAGNLGTGREDTLSRVQREFHKFSEFLQVVDKPEGVFDRDPLGYSLERLERHSSGVLLRKHLDSWLGVLAEELNPDAGKGSVVLMPVDDADMSLKDLVTTLGTFRRYLTHPRLVPVFTFTDRLAEELLKTHFANCLTVGGGGEERAGDSGQERGSPSSRDMTAQLAYQYLVKLFPIRNRIRLGPAPARAQASFYRVISTQKNGRKVRHLLSTASRLLFGCARWPTLPESRLALRPSTLRRQLQVIDAMNDARVLEIHQIDQMKQRRLSWAAIFDKAAWSLLNVHRDVLAEYNLYIEDLYSWTPETLRRALLDYILSLDLESRRRLIKQWRYGIEDRRSQTLSLLAANTFRPQMQGEELSGDDPDKIVHLGSTHSTRVMECPQTFSLLKGILWFLNLWIGFYLPQILARNRRDDIAKEDPYKGRVRGVGWDLYSGPTHAIREALANGEAASTGMMLLEPHEFSQQIRLGNGGGGSERSDKINLLLHLWCLYGQERDPWAAASFWRGLALLGQLLILREREIFKQLHPVDAQEGGKDPVGKQNPSEGEASAPGHQPTDHGTGGSIRAHVPNGPDVFEEGIQAIISNHCGGIRVPGILGEAAVEYDPYRPERRFQGVVKKLAKEIKEWLLTFEDRRIYPFMQVAERGGSNANDANSQNDNENGRSARAAWQDCFIRRMHGEYILGDFWRMLEGIYLERPDTDQTLEEEGAGESKWTAWTAMSKWVEALLIYSEKGSKGKGAPHITLFFAACPFIRPFISSARETELISQLKKLHGQPRKDLEQEAFFQPAEVWRVFNCLKRLASFEGGSRTV